MICGFGPIARPDAKVLILGTLPSEASLAAGEYYAHPRNAFWYIMERLFAGQTGLDYTARKSLLINARVALWDVLLAAERCGSMDSNIVPGSEQANDFAEFFARYPDIRTVFFNGGNAEALFHRLVAPKPNLRFVRLPSTSPAAARLTRDRKYEQWRSTLLEALNDYDCRAAGIADCADALLP